MNPKSNEAGASLIPVRHHIYRKGNNMLNLCSKLLRGSLTAFVLLFSVNAQALLINNINDNIAANSYLSAGTYTGTFDINALMNSTFGGQNYSINSGSINFLFTDDGSDVYYTGTNTSTYGSHYYGYNYYNYRQYYNPYESATANVGDQSSTGAPSYYSTGNLYAGSSTGQHWVSSGYSHSYSCGFLWLSTCSEWIDTSHYVTDRYYYYNNQYGYAMNSAFNMGLDGTAINDLSLDGLLNYSLNVGGDLIFNYAYLNLDVSLVPGNSGSNVPEPGSLALLGLGLISMLSMRQRRRM